MDNYLAVIWNPDSELCRLFGLPIRYYSLMWVAGLVAAYFLVRKFYKDRGIKPEVFEPLFLYCFIGILAGARLGHCLFYEPDYYLSSGRHFIEMLLPIRFMPEGGWKMVGYSGLASHGGTIGIFIGILLYCRKYKVKLLECVDMICVATPLTAACIRIGNLMNSEIVGKATGTGWGFIFLISRKHKEKVGSGFYFGFCIAAIFTFRFFIEFCKEVQVDFEHGMVLDMGQILSIPFAIAGIWLMLRSRKK